MLAHLAHGGFSLARGWEGVGLAADGTLRLPRPAPGRARVLNQSLLRELVARLFGSDEVAGRGEARRVVRGQVEGWRQSLTAVSPDQVVGDLLERAPFLWEPRFAGARCALVGECRRAEHWQLWLAGPSARRRRLLSAAAGREALEALLASGQARALWEGAGREEPLRLAAAGQYSAAVAAWTLDPPRSPEGRLALGEALYALGQFGKALAAVAEPRTAAARLLRARCQVKLGHLQAALGAMRRLSQASLGAGETLALAEVAVRVLANLGERDEVRDWVARARALAGVDGTLAPRAELLAALAAWDRGDLPEMRARLAASREAAMADPDLAWRWRSAASFAARGEGRLADGAEHLRRALSRRRRLARFEAGELWNELGICRAGLGDLAGAERAFLHTVRLLGSCEGPRKTTLALYNLAEIRLRRGHLLGVREIVEQATLENRLTGNVRGGVQDAELWARFELAQGRARAAFAHCREALDVLARRRLSWRRGVLSALAARALGWLGRRSEAAQHLAAADAEALAELEPEERPALFALAGDREAALGQAAATPLAGLWQALLEGGEVPDPAWGSLSDLEPYRAARLVFDAEQVSPGAVPPHWLRRAIATLRRVGAGALAEPLEARDVGPWQALVSYLESPRDAPAFTDLLRRTGYGEARLAWIVEGEERLLADGPGGAHEVEAPAGEGRLVLSMPGAVDSVLRGFLALAACDLADPERGSSGPSPGGRSGDGQLTGGLLGESAILTAAVERLRRLAPADLPVLVLGESGTGKELAARLVHRASSRAAQPFVALNCAAVSESLLLSDLFGHVRGAFTGADRDRAGVFEAAQGGTVFLDEIGDLPLAAQGMLLRVLQEGEVRRVGESLPRKVRVRVVAATHHDLAQKVADGGFRQDLYFRLKVAAVKLPALRERGPDVLLLADHFLSRVGGDPPPRLSSEARRLLTTHAWPGNVRELQNVLNVAAALAADEGGLIERDHLDLPATAEAPKGDFHRLVNAFRRQLLEEALAVAGGNRAEAARRLGMSRQALSYLVRQLRLT